MWGGEHPQFLACAIYFICIYCNFLCALPFYAREIAEFVITTGWGSCEYAFTAKIILSSQGQSNNFSMNYPVNQIARSLVGIKVYVLNQSSTFVIHAMCFATL